MWAERNEVRFVAESPETGRSQTSPLASSPGISRAEFPCLGRIATGSPLPGCARFISRHKCQHTAVIRMQKLQAAAAQRAGAGAVLDEPLHPPKQRVGIALLGLHADGFEAIFGIDDYRQVQLRRV